MPIPKYTINRIEVAGEENEYAKMFDPRPVGASPTLPEPLNPTNPVPEVMQALGLGAVRTPHTVQRNLLNGLNLTTWDNRPGGLNFFVFADSDFSAPSYPAPTTRVPRGVLFHGQTQGKGPPPHTIHWHGIEPTPINDGVGHCSMEIGSYLYQWQPNFIGSYFYHCHRNTMQHFEFGLFGNLFIEPPDAYFASITGADFRTQTVPAVITLNSIPVGACSDGRFRIAANLLNLPAAVQAPFLPTFVGGDPTFGVATQTQTLADLNPHAFTVAYDVEAMWVLDDRDSTWSDLGRGAFDTFPTFGTIPGSNDTFNGNAGVAGFFAFNDFHADYWFVSGVPVPGLPGTTATINPAGAAPSGGGLPGGLIPPVLNSGRSGTQVAVNARVGQTILIRCLDAAYNKTRITFPVDIVVIAWDGRALGVPPFGLYNHSFVLPANTPITISTARRFDALVNSPVPVSSAVKVEFLDTRGDGLLMTALIPFVIAA